VLQKPKSRKVRRSMTYCCCQTELGLFDSLPNLYLAPALVIPCIPA
jgi:hypothetical protein